MSQLTEKERRILAVLQQGLLLTETPYADLTKRIGIKTDEFLEVLRDWKRQRVLRRIGAVVNHFELGKGAGAMVIWVVPDDKVEQIGEIFAGFSQVSHAYERQMREDWHYNIYTMVHAVDAAELDAVVEQMSKAGSISEYKVLKTLRELKKSPPRYVIEQ